MEFSEKLQNLRKKKGMTQEELAAELYVSRTAISKWESGKGYPSIDSLKEISKYFSVTIDELLSSEELITAAQCENSRNISDLLDLLTGLTDIMALLMILLPLYPEKIYDSIAAVGLVRFTYNSFTAAIVCWSMYVMLIIIGAVKVLMNYIHIEKGRNALTIVSFVISIFAVLFLTAERLPYAVTVIFLILIVKSVLLLKTQRQRDIKNP